MNRKQALIVDDSKTAQYLLKRMLQQYVLEIDVAASAEEALAYLSYNHPAVIFLDQQMTGMTGFEALKTIKANPHTALIPVIMYSSQNDDLFVSQAIALGAQGFLTKSAMHPANLQQVLERLNIRREAAPAMEAGAAAEAVAAPVPQPVAAEAAAPVRAAPAAPSADLDKVRAQVGRLFELHIADVRSQIDRSAQFLLKRLSTSLEKPAQREAVIGSNAMAAFKSTVGSALAAQRRQGTRAGLWTLGVTLAALCAFAWWQWQVRADIDAAAAKILAALEVQKEDRSMMRIAALAPAAAPVPAAAPASEAAGAARAEAVHPALLQAISWAQHADFHFDYGEQPLSGNRLANLHQLVQLLAEGGYRGPLVINLDFGNFCLEFDEANALRLARSDTRAASCKMQKDLSPRFLANDYLTLQYQAFEKNSAPLQDGRITLRLVSNGMSTPVVDYPLLTPQTSAGEWNRAALRNNRISVHIPR